MDSGGCISNYCHVKFLIGSQKDTLVTWSAKRSAYGHAPKNTRLAASIRLFAHSTQRLIGNINIQGLHKDGQNSSIKIHGRPHPAAKHAHLQSGNLRCPATHDSATRRGKLKPTNSTMPTMPPPGQLEPTDSVMRDVWTWRSANIEASTNYEVACNWISTYVTPNRLSFLLT